MDAFGAPGIETPEQRSWDPAADSLEIRREGVLRWRSTASSADERGTAGPAAAAHSGPPPKTQTPLSELLAIASLALLAAALYRRLSGSQAREQSARARLLESIRGSPGQSFSELARASGLHGSTIRYHAELLEEFGAVVVQRDGRTVRVFENRDRYSPAEREELLARSRAGARRILRSLPAEGTDVLELARRYGVTPRAVRKQLPRLAAAGVVRIERRGRMRWITPVPSSAPSTCRRTESP